MILSWTPHFYLFYLSPLPRILAFLKTSLLKQILFNGPITKQDQLTTGRTHRNTSATNQWATVSHPPPPSNFFFLHIVPLLPFSSGIISDFFSEQPIGKKLLFYKTQETLWFLKMIII